MATISFDSRSNFAISTVATAPNTPTAGTTLTVATGEGARFPAAPFNATIAAANSIATSSNAEIVRVASRSGDVLTLNRQQESSSARAVVAGDVIYAGFTNKSLTDIEAYVNSYLGDAYQRTPTSTLFYQIPGCAGSASRDEYFSANSDYYFPFWLDTDCVIDSAQLPSNNTGNVNAYMAVYRADQAWSPTTRMVSATGSTNASVYTATSLGTVALTKGRYLFALNISQAVSFYGCAVAFLSSGVWVQTGSGVRVVGFLAPTRSAAVFPSTAPAINGQHGLAYPFSLRVSSIAA